MDFEVLEEVIVSVEVFVTKGVRALEGCSLGKEARSLVFRKFYDLGYDGLTFLVRVYRTNVPLEVLSTVKALPAALDLTYIHPRICRRVAIAVFNREFRRYPAPPTFLRQIRDGHGEIRPQFWIGAISTGTRR